MVILLKIKQIRPVKAINPGDVAEYCPKACPKTAPTSAERVNKATNNKKQAEPTIGPLHRLGQILLRSNHLKHTRSVSSAPIPLHAYTTANISASSHGNHNKQSIVPKSIKLAVAKRANERDEYHNRLKTAGSLLTLNLPQIKAYEQSPAPPLCNAPRARRAE